MRHARQSGVSLIEMMIGITIAALLMMIGLPSMVTWLNNSQIRTAGETLLAGLTLARVEAVKRNQVVRFQLVSDLTSSCTLVAAGTPVAATGWVVSLADPSSACNAAPSETVAPQIIQAKSGGEGTSKVSIAATGAATVYFNGLGRVTSPSGAPNLTQILITNPGGGACEHVDPTNGTMRCLQINISTGGEVKMCDPAVTASDDPRKC
jgi:type IV fimbrial biogenesis protein FimT